MHSKWAANRLQHPHCSTWWWVCNHLRPKVSKTDLCCLVAHTVQWLCNNYFNVVWCNEAINCGFMAQVANFSAAWYLHQTQICHDNYFDYLAICLWKKRLAFSMSILALPCEHSTFDIWCSVSSPMNNLRFRDHWLLQWLLNPKTSSSVAYRIRWWLI